MKAAQQDEEMGTPIHALIEVAQAELDTARDLAARPKSPGVASDLEHSLRRALCPLQEALERTKK